MIFRNVDPGLHADSADISSTDILKRGFGSDLERRVLGILCYGNVGSFNKKRYDDEKDFICSFYGAYLFRRLCE
mgnify:CR=1 FL=1